MDVGQLQTNCGAAEVGGGREPEDSIFLLDLLPDWSFSKFLCFLLPVVYSTNWSFILCKKVEVGM